MCVVTCHVFSFVGQFAWAGELGDETDVRSEGYEVNQGVLGWEGKDGSGCGLLIRVADREWSLAVCKIVLPLVEGSAMQTDIKGCELSVRTLDVSFKYGTLVFEKAWKAQRMERGQDKKDICQHVYT